MLDSERGRPSDLFPFALEDKAETCLKADLACTIQISAIFFFPYFLKVFLCIFFFRRACTLHTQTA
jgi:hypothetical protein